MLSLIVAHDLNFGIGKNNLLPWKLEKDLQFFSKMTKNSIVIMGKNTYLSIGKPLKNRTNIVLSSTLKDDNITIFSDFNDLLLFISKSELPVWVIGGTQIYKQFLSIPYLVDQIHISLIHSTFDCDTYFPKLPNNFKRKNHSFSYEEDDLTITNLIYTSK